MSINNLDSHVPAARHAQLRDAADSLADLRCCDIDDLDDALELLQWPDPERRRFLEAWRALGAEASVPFGAAAVDNPAANAPAIDPAVYARSPFRRGQLVLVPAAAFGDDYASEHPQTLPGSLVSITNVERDEAGGERRLWNVSYADYAWETDESWFLGGRRAAASASAACGSFAPSGHLPQGLRGPSSRRCVVATLCFAEGRW